MNEAAVLCGAGRISAFHAHALDAAGVRVVAVVDPRADAARAAAAPWGAAVFDGLEQALAGVPSDLVVVATPHDLHAPQAAAALRAGRDVFTDKPLALTPGEGRDLVDLAGRLGRRLGVCHNLLFHPAVERARALLSEGVVGRPVAVDAWSLGWLDLAPWDFRTDRARTGGGALVDAGPHLLYTVRDLVGPVAELRAFGRQGASRLGGEDTVAASGRTRSGVPVSLRISYSHRSPGSHLPWPDGWRQGLEITGTEGAVRFEVTPRSRLWSCRGEAAEWTEHAVEAPFSTSFDGALADFVAARRAGGTPRVTPEQSLEILQLISDAAA